jgi:uncharacterized membrane protein
MALKSKTDVIYLPLDEKITTEILHNVIFLIYSYAKYSSSFVNILTMHIDSLHIKK